MSDINLLESIRTTMAEVASLIEKRMKNDLRAFAEAEVHRNISCIFVFLYFCIFVYVYFVVAQNQCGRQGGQQAKAEGGR